MYSGSREVSSGIREVFLDSGNFAKLVGYYLLEFMRFLSVELELVVSVNRNTKTN